ncbi:hypothetical protein ACN26Y_14095 [Micromonospora sp. WMMD558]|uniref:hypothetical protein n=1 Tax=Micromonospora sp. WMMD558 TaxID=3403462 RepID=UPI003BF4B81F
MIGSDDFWALIDVSATAAGDPAELRRRYPRLAVPFPLPAGAGTGVWETARP